jgi:cellulose biosynthesis protein BcsQ
MKKISFFSRKGGSGKTLCSMLVGQSLESEIGSVRYTDLDEQGSLREVIRYREYVNPKEPSIEIVDYPPRLTGIKVINNLKDSDIIVIPTTLNPVDLMVVQQTVDYLKNESVNLKRVFVLLNQVKTFTLEFKEKKDLLKELPVVVLRNWIPYRTSYSRVPLNGYTGLPKSDREIIIKLSREIYRKNVPKKIDKDDWKWRRGDKTRSAPGYQYRGKYVPKRKKST